LGTSTFTSSFIKDALLEDVQDVDLLLIKGDVQIAFGILIHCFMQWPSYLLQCTPPFSTFIKSLISFDSSFFQMFGHLLGLGSFDSPKRFIAHKQASLPIIFDGIKFILIVIIALITYLKSWAFAISIIVARFMGDQCPIIFKALT
jgi:hypothetical protein